MANRENQEPNNQESAAASGFSQTSQTRTRSWWKVPLLTFAVTVLVVWGVGAFAYPYLLYASHLQRGWRTRSSSTA